MMGPKKSRRDGNGWARKHRQAASRTVRRHLQCESLESRLTLNGTGLAGNAFVPDLDLAALGVQSAKVGEVLTLNLFAQGATVSDLDGSGTPTGDAIRLQLDPDDTPAGATLTTDGIFRWTPTAAQLGRFEFVVIAVDSGTPRLADAEVFVVEVADNFAPNLAAIADGQATQGQLFEVTITATDPDGDDLTFLLDRDDPGATLPSGAGIEQVDNNTAVIRWTPSASDGTGTFTFSVLVIDDGSPALSDREVFTVTVQGNDQGASQPVSGDAPVAADDAYSLAVPTIPGGLPPGGLPTGGIPTGGLPPGGVPTGGRPWTPARRFGAHGRRNGWRTGQ